MWGPAEICEPSVLIFSNNAVMVIRGLLVSGVLGKPRAQSGQFEELVDELNLTPNIRSAHPPNLPLPQHVHRLITLNRSLRRLEFSEPLLGVYPAFDRAMILLQDIVQVLHRSGPY